MSRAHTGSNKSKEKEYLMWKDFHCRNVSFVPTGRGNLDGLVIGTFNIMISFNQFDNPPPGKLTCPLKRDYFSRECIVGYVIFREGTFLFF